MTAKPATIADYGTLYAGDYMTNNWAWRASGIEPQLAAHPIVIEAGAGRGQFARAMQARGMRWTAFDPHPTTPWVRRGALPALPVKDRAFELSVTIDVLEHIHPDDILPCLAELRRVAHRGAWAIANMSDVQPVAGIPTELHLIQKSPGWWIEQVRSIGGIATPRKTDIPERFWLDVTW